MKLWPIAEHHFPSRRTPQRRADSERLAAKIADALAVTGEYSARVDLELSYQVVNFTWAARQAGRNLGIRVDVQTKVTKPYDGTAEVRVAAASPPS